MPTTASTFEETYAPPSSPHEEGVDSISPLSPTPARADGNDDEVDDGDNDGKDNSNDDHDQHNNDEEEPAEQREHESDEENESVMAVAEVPSPLTGLPPPKKKRRPYQTRGGSRRARKQLCICTWPECYEIQRQLRERTKGNNKSKHPHAIFTGYVSFKNVCTGEKPKHAAYRQLLYRCFACQPQQQQEQQQNGVEDGDGDGDNDAKPSSCTKHWICTLLRPDVVEAERELGPNRPNRLARHHYTKQQLEFLYRPVYPGAPHGRANYPSMPVERHMAEVASPYFSLDQDAAPEGGLYFFAPSVPRDVVLEHLEITPLPPPPPDGGGNDDNDDSSDYESYIAKNGKRRRRRRKKKSNRGEQPDDTEARDAAAAAAAAAEQANPLLDPAAAMTIVTTLDRLVDAQQQFCQHWQQSVAQLQLGLLQVKQLLRPTPSSTQQQEPGFVAVSAAIATATMHASEAASATGSAPSYPPAVASVEDHHAATAASPLVTPADPVINVDVITTPPPLEGDKFHRRHSHDGCNTGNDDSKNNSNNNNEPSQSLDASTQQKRRRPHLPRRL